MGFKGRIYNLEFFPKLHISYDPGLLFNLVNRNFGSIELGEQKQIDLLDVLESKTEKMEVSKISK